MTTNFTVLNDGPRNEIFLSLKWNLKRCFATFCMWLIQPCGEMPSHATICKSTTLVIIYHSLSWHKLLGGHKNEGEPNKPCPQNMAKDRCHSYCASFDLDLFLPVSWFTEPPLLLFLSFFHSLPTYFAYWQHKTVFSFQPSRACWVNGSISHRISLEVWLLFLPLISCVVTALCLIWTLSSSAGSCSMRLASEQSTWCHMMHSMMALMDDGTITCITHQLELLTVFSIQAGSSKHNNDNNGIQCYCHDRIIRLSYLASSFPYYLLAGYVMRQMRLSVWLQGVTSVPFPLKNHFERKQQVQHHTKEISFMHIQIISTSS